MTPVRQAKKTKPTTNYRAKKKTEKEQKGVSRKVRQPRSAEEMYTAKG